MKSEVLLFPVLLLCTAFIQNVHGFLLEGPTNGGKHTTANSQFLTNTEFLQAKQVLKQNTDDLRHDMDKTFALMTAQLKSKFDLLEIKLADVDKRNETSNNCVSTEKYIALEQKLTIAEQKITNVQRENDRMKQENVVVKNEIEQLKKIGAIKPLQEFAALQQSVHLNTDKIHSLSMNEQARSQDFLALYNLTTVTGRKLTEMETSTNSLIRQLEHNQTMTTNNLKQGLDNQLISFQASYNATVKDLQTKEIYPIRQSVQLNTDKIHVLAMQEQARSQDFSALYNITTSTKKKVIEMKTSTNKLILQLKNNQTIDIKIMKQNLESQLIRFQTNYNSTINDLHTKEMSMQKQITENNERVALFAWASDRNGNLIRFNNIQLSEGIKNISAFKSTGKFVCEKEGLYLMAVTVASIVSSNFCINQGTKTVSCTEIGIHSGNAWHSGTSVATLHLHVNDNISITTGHTIETLSWTQFTLIKIK